MQIDLSQFPPCGPYIIDNPGPERMTVSDTLGSVIGTVEPGRRAWLLVKEDGAGNRTPVLLS